MKVRISFDCAHIYFAIVLLVDLFAMLQFNAKNLLVVFFETKLELCLKVAELKNMNDWQALFLLFRQHQIYYGAQTNKNCSLFLTQRLWVVYG